MGVIKFGWWNSSFTSAQAPIVLGGCSRSGTTLLQAILNAHSEVYIGPETALFCGNKNLHHLARVTSMEMGRLSAHLRRSACFAEFTQRVLLELTEQAKKQYWGEKTPANVHHLQAIFRCFPKARFVHIIRDGRDVVSSLRTHPKYRWENGKRLPTNIINPWDKCVAEWVTDVRKGLAWRGDPRYLEVRYERLVANPEATSRWLLGSLGLAWQPSVLEAYKSNHSPTHPGLAKPIYTDAVGRWRVDLPNEALGHFGPDATALLAELAYPST